MAKKEKDPTAAAAGTPASYADDLFKAIGDNDEAQQVTHFIDTGYPPLNVALSGRADGGLPQGRLIEMFGESSTGKTALATNWMVKAQEMGGIAGFIDWERSFAVSLAEGFGLKTESPYWIYKRPQTWEEGNTIAAKACAVIRQRKMIPDEAPILFVFDSIAAAMPKSVSEKEMDELSMNDTTALARVTSTTLKNMAYFAGEYNATFLYLNQIRLKPGVVYGDPRGTPGGKAMEFYSTCRMALGRSKIAEGDSFLGQDISIQVVKTKLTRPFQKTNLRMMYDEIDVAFFDYIGSAIEHLIKVGVIGKAGSYIKFEGDNVYKKDLIQRASIDPVVYAKIMELLSDAL